MATTDESSEIPECSWSLPLVIINPQSLASDIHYPTVSPSITVKSLISDDLITSNRLAAGNTGSLEGSVNKANKGRKAAFRFQHLVNGGRKGEKSSSRVIVGPSIDCDSLPSAGQRRYAEGIKTFEEISFYHDPCLAKGLHSSSAVESQPFAEDGEGFSRHYLHFSCPTLRVDDTLVSSNGSAKYDSIEINTGACLFSMNILESSTPPDGQVELQKLQYAAPTFYEMAYIAAAAPAIADIAIIMSSRLLSTSNVTPVNINLDIPSFHYYKAIDGRLREGRCSPDTALLWLEAVERRHDQIATVFETALQHECHKRGDFALPINISPTHNAVMKGIKAALLGGNAPDFDAIFANFCESEGNVWREFYELIPEKEHPKNFHALGHLLYVYQVISPALTGRRRYQKVRRTLKRDDQECFQLLDLDDHTEVLHDPCGTETMATPPPIAGTRSRSLFSQDGLLDVVKALGMFAESFEDGHISLIREEPRAAKLFSSAARSFQRMAKEARHINSVQEASSAEMNEGDQASDSASTPKSSRCMSPQSITSSISSLPLSPEPRTPQDEASTSPMLNESNNKPNVLIVSLDNISEQKIYSRSQKILKKLRSSPSASCSATLVEAYLMQQVFNGEDIASTPYLFDPSPVRPIDDQGNEVAPVDLVRTLYGNELASNLERWFAEVDLR